MNFCVVRCIFVLFYVFLCCSMYFCVVLLFVVLFYVFLCCSMYCLFCSMYFFVFPCVFVLFSVFLCCSIIFFIVLCIIVLFYVLFVLCRSVYSFCVYICTLLLPPGGYPIAVNKYIISYYFYENDMKLIHFAP